VFSLLSPAAFQECFSAWIESVRAAHSGEEIVAIDGKSQRRSHDRNGILAKLDAIALAFRSANSVRESEGIQNRDAVGRPVPIQPD
jgi:hypothetical protein